MHQRDVWVFLPVGGNLIWCLVTIFAGPPALPTDGTGCALLAVFVSGVAMSGIFGFISNDIGPAKSFVAMLSQTAILIGIYAQLYMFRLDIDGTAIDFWDALYVSVSTWTSLGYADVHPMGEMRLVTSVQSITGYVFLGLLVSLLSNVVTAPKPAPAGLLDEAENQGDDGKQDAARGE